MRILSTVLILLLPPGLAAADDSVFDRAAGLFGSINEGRIACGVNPMQVSFSANGTRAHFKWASPIIDYEGEWRTRADYTIFAHDETSITMQLDGESRLGADGAPMVWLYEIYDNSNTCWKDASYPYGFCKGIYHACQSDPPVS